MVLQVVDSTIKGYDWFEPNSEKNDKGKFLEWTMTVTVISMFISIAMDSRHFEFVYSETKNEEIHA